MIFVLTLSFILAVLVVSLFCFRAAICDQLLFRKKGFDGILMSILLWCLVPAWAVVIITAFRSVVLWSCY